MTGTIHTAINAVMGKVAYIRKEKTGGLKYSFASESAFINAIRQHLVDEGVYVHPYRVESINLDSYETRNGSTMNMATAVVTYQFQHAPSATSIEVTVIGQGADTGDKATNKAMTGAYKYALRQTLMIETGDDPDRTASQEQERGKGKASQKALANGTPEKPLASDTPLTDLDPKYWDLLNTLDGAQAWTVAQICDKAVETGLYGNRHGALGSIKKHKWDDVKLDVSLKADRAKNMLEWLLVHKQEAV